ncbi:MAG: hypothetical protein K0M78_02545, partial [Brevundimonas sp.]|nr:hypothetical protein [Brevundimonas sp.]
RAGPASAQTAEVPEAGIPHQSCPLLERPERVLPSGAADNDVYVLGDMDRDPTSSDLRDPEVWRSPKSALPQHMTLRSRLGIEMPTGSSQILIFEETGHNVYNERSTVATRGDDGRWRVDEAVERWVGTRDAYDGYARWILSKETGRQLDALLADPCLAADPRRNTGWTGSWSGIWQWTIEIRTPQAALRFLRVTTGFGRASRVSELLNKDRP